MYMCHVLYMYMYMYVSLTILQAVATMVEECCRFVDQTPNLETKLKFIDTLRTVSEGKVHVHVYMNNHVHSQMHTREREQREGEKRTTCKFTAALAA